MIENSILIIVSSFCMERMIISYVDFRSCHKHFPNSLPLCQMNHAHNGHCHQMWLVGGATFTQIFTRIIAEVHHHGSADYNAATSGSVGLVD